MIHDCFVLFHIQSKTTGVYDCQILAFPLSMLFSGDLLYCRGAGADPCNRGPPLQPGMSKVRRWSTAVTQGPSDHAAKLSIIGLDTGHSHLTQDDHHDGQHQFYSTMVAGVLVSDCWRCVLLYSLLRRLTTFSPHNTVAKMKHSIPRCLTTWGVDIPI